MDVEEGEVQALRVYTRRPRRGDPLPGTTRTQNATAPAHAGSAADDHPEWEDGECALETRTADSPLPLPLPCHRKEALYFEALDNEALEEEEGGESEGGEEFEAEGPGFVSFTTPYEPIPALTYNRLKGETRKKARRRPNTGGGRRGREPSDPFSPPASARSGPKKARGPAESGNAGGRRGQEPSDPFSPPASARSGPKKARGPAKSGSHAKRLAPDRAESPVPYGPDDPRRVFLGLEFDLPDEDEDVDDILHRGDEEAAKRCPPPDTLSLVPSGGSAGPAAGPTTPGIALSPPGHGGGDLGARGIAGGDGGTGTACPASAAPRTPGLGEGSGEGISTALDALSTALLDL